MWLGCCTSGVEGSKKWTVVDVHCQAVPVYRATMVLARCLLQILTEMATWTWLRDDKIAWYSRATRGRYELKTVVFHMDSNPKTLAKTNGSLVASGSFGGEVGLQLPGNPSQASTAQVEGGEATVLMADDLDLTMDSVVMGGGDSLGGVELSVI